MELGSPSSVDNLARQARRQLAALLPTASDFDAFCLDCFREVHQRFAQGMNRLDRVNLLLTMMEVTEVLAALQRWDPEAFDRHSLEAVSYTHLTLPTSDLV